MRRSRLPLFVLFTVGVFTLAGCNSIKTYTDYEVTTTFKDYSSFGFYEEMDTGFNELDEKRVASLLTKTMEEMDLKSGREIDFRINFYAETHEDIQRHNMHIGIGAIGGNVAGNIGSGIPLDSHRKIISLTVEFVDAQTDRLFWQGIVEAKWKPNLTPEERLKFFEKLITKLLKDYPPRS